MGEGDNRGKKEKGCQGTCVNDPWTKPKGGRTEGGRRGWVGGAEESGGGKMKATVFKQHLKNDKKFVFGGERWHKTPLLPF